MSKKEEFYAEHFEGEHSAFKIVGEFCNEHGERYVIYTPKSDYIPLFLISGDEMDWEGSYQYLPKLKMIADVFMANAIELKTCETLVNRYMENK